MGNHRLELDGADFKGIGEQRARIRIPTKRVIMRPGDQRGFIHKKLLGGISAISGFLPIPGANIVSGITGALAGGRGRAAPVRPGLFRGGGTGRTIPRTQTARPSAFSGAEKELGRALKFGELPQLFGFGGPGADCRPPARINPRTGICETPVEGVKGRVQRALPGGRSGFEVATGPVGEAVMGRFGAGLVPGSMMIDRAVCLRGMTLGVDGLCYNKGQITNKQRMWPRGRRPLLTGGDMRAIGVASRAAGKLERTTKRLQRMGMMKKPASRARHQHARRATGVVSV